MEEGIQFSFLTNPVEFIGDEQGYVRAMRCVRMAMGDLDEKGRRKFSVIEGSEFEMEIDNVVVATPSSRALRPASTPSRGVVSKPMPTD